MTVEFVEFDSLAEYTAWETARRIQLGIPITGRHRGRLDDTKQKTVAYSSSIRHRTLDTVLAFADETARGTIPSDKIITRQEADSRGWDIL